MKKKSYLVISIISFIFGGINCGIVILFSLFGSFMCSNPFYIISGSDGPIPRCTSIFNTDFIWPLLVGGVAILLGIIFVILYNKKKVNINN